MAASASAIALFLLQRVTCSWTLRVFRAASLLSGMRLPLHSFVLISLCIDACDVCQGRFHWLLQPQLAFLCRPFALRLSFARNNWSSSGPSSDTDMVIRQRRLPYCALHTDTSRGMHEPPATSVSPSRENQFTSSLTWRTDTFYWRTFGRVWANGCAAQAGSAHGMPPASFCPLHGPAQRNRQWRNRCLHPPWLPRLHGCRLSTCVMLSGCIDSRTTSASTDQQRPQRQQPHAGLHQTAIRIPADIKRSLLMCSVASSVARCSFVSA